MSEKNEKRAIILRESDSSPSDSVGVAAPLSRVGLGSSYDNVISGLNQLAAYFQNLLKNNPNDLTAGQMETVVIGTALAATAMRQEDGQVIADQQQQINSLSKTSQTATAQAQSGVSAAGATFIAIGSALTGGVGGWYLRGRKK